jgi:hypothetical protein
MIWKAIFSLKIELLSLALDLCVPPLAVLTLLAGVDWLLCAAIYASVGSQIPLAMASFVVLLLAAAILLSWSRYGRNTVSLTQLMLVPLYVIAKLPIYIRFLVARQGQWVRSKRGSDP